MIGKEMPRYKCHKEVWALRIKDMERIHMDDSIKIYPVENGYSPFVVSQDFFTKHNPRIGGYIVQYEDGYRSYSPAAAFESGYTLIKDNLKRKENMGDELFEQNVHNFKYHESTPGQVGVYEELRNKARELADKIAAQCPPSRERSLAITKIEEAIFWANASIARN